MDELKALSVGYVLFVLLIIGEILYGLLRKRPGYRIGELVVNVGHGMVFQTGDLFTKALVMLPFMWVSEHHALAALPMDSVGAWIVGLFAFDFCGYWRHRHHHEINFLWAVHGVHHAAEDFNFGAALRQALFGNVLGWAWTVPLALFIPLDMFVGIIVFDYLYQFVQHTRHVPKLGPVEWLMNTPSHHRVHHGTEAKYLDRNYGGIFIVWDRLFGTFQVEQEEPTYGLTKPLGTLNPVWGNLVLFASLAAACGRTKTVLAGLQVWLVGPGRTDELAPGGTTRERKPLENHEIPLALALYATATFVSNTALLLALIWAPSDELLLRVALGGLVVLGAAVPAALIEQRKWARPVEGLRLAGLALVATSLSPSLPTLTACCVAMAVAMLAGVQLLTARRAASQSASSELISPLGGGQ
jgi:alkylglycerol monooxygenase